MTGYKVSSSASRKMTPAMTIRRYLRFMFFPPYGSPRRFPSGADGGLLGFFAGGDNDADGGGSHKQDSRQAVHPHTVIAGSRQVKAAGVDHGQRRFRIGRSVILQHVDLVAIHIS